MKHKKISTVNCPCTNIYCKDVHLKNIGKFVQGSGFTKTEAAFIVKACNNHYVLVETLENILNYEESGSIEDRDKRIIEMCEQTLKEINK